MHRPADLGKLSATQVHIGPRPQKLGCDPSQPVEAWRFLLVAWRRRTSQSSERMKGRRPTPCEAEASRPPRRALPESSFNPVSKHNRAGSAPGDFAWRGTRTLDAQYERRALVRTKRHSELRGKRGTQGSETSSSDPEVNETATPREGPPSSTGPAQKIATSSTESKPLRALGADGRAPRPLAHRPTGARERALLRQA